MSMQNRRPGRRAPILAMVLMLAPLACSLAAARQQPPRVNPNALELKEFSERVQSYVALHKKLEGTLPSLPDRATPEQIVAHQKALAEKIRAERAKAKPGDIFIPSVQDQLRKFVRDELKGQDGRETLALIKETPASAPMRVNALYPQNVPLTSMPPGILQRLPRLPEEVEYRFVGRDLILRDTHAELIVDFMRGVIPAAARASR